MVAMNAQTYAADLAEVSAGGWSYLRLDLAASSRYRRRWTSLFSVFRCRAMCNERFEDARARILMKNMAYVGALAALLDLDMEVLAV